MTRLRKLKDSPVVIILGIVVVVALFVYLNFR